MTKKKAPPSPLEKRVKALSSLDHACLVALALRTTPHNQSSWATWLKELGIRHPPNPEGASSKVRRQISTTDLHDMMQPKGVRALLHTMPRDPNFIQVADSALDAVLSNPRAKPVLKKVLERHNRVRPEKDPWRWRHAERYTEQLTTARAAMYLGPESLATDLIRDAIETRATQHYYFDDERPATLLELLPISSTAESVRRLPDLYQIQFFGHALRECVKVPSILRPEVMDLFMAADAPELLSQRPLAVSLMALASGCNNAVELLADQNTPGAMQALALAHLHDGNVPAARKLTLNAFELSRGTKGHKKPWLDSTYAPLLTLVLATGDTQCQTAARIQVERAQKKRPDRASHAPIKMLLENQHPISTMAEMEGVNHWQTSLLTALVSCYMGAPPGAPETTETAPWIDRPGVTRAIEGFQSAGMQWLAHQLEGLLTRINAPEPPEAPEAPEAPETSTVLFDLQRPVPAWQRSLEQLNSLIASESPSDTQDPGDGALGPQERLIFAYTKRKPNPPMGEPYSSSHPAQPPDPEAIKRSGSLRFEFQPRVQKRTRHGYSRGRPVSLRTLCDKPESFDYLSDHDRQVLASISVTRSWHGGQDYRFKARALRALVGHTHIHNLDDITAPPKPMVESAFALEVTLTPTGLRLQLTPEPNHDGTALYEDAQGQLALCILNKQQQQVHEALQHMEPIPEAGRQQLDAILASLSSLFTVHADTALSSTGNASQVEPIATPVVILKRADPGLTVRIIVMPLGPEGPSLVCGKGLRTVTASIAGQPTQCARDLAAETAALASAAQTIPALERAALAQELAIDTLPECLHFLHSLETIGDQVSVQWAEGDAIELGTDAETEHLNLQLSERQQWLEVDGSLRISEDLVLPLTELMAARTQDGAFVQIGDAHFVPLSTRLQEQLSALHTAAVDTAGKKKKNPGLRLPPVALGFVSPWLRELRQDGLKIDARAKARLTAIRQAMEGRPNVPKTFEAHFRPYQLDGYQFLSRLGQIGAGAILADDMGLGKTLMTLALLIERAPNGPALVIAPVSVKGNWCDEAMRFAPTLNMHRLEGGDASGVEHLGAYDVAVCSYAFVTHHVESLQHLQLSTLVLDEAQAVKNASTHRARAVRKLAADARIALTGTPVENHLGDLFSLMDFINPGLLGTGKQFETRFGKPIQKEGDAKASQDLRALIAPFTLRRRKSDVLKELPPRTEIVVEVQPSDEELAFVEALRRDALQRLQNPNPKQKKAGGAVSILAEITRLRRAACHPSLGDKLAGKEIGGAKLERLIEIMHDLKAEGHRALVFSQFVDFLHIVSTRFKQEGFSHQYLDGSTLEAKRNRAVVDFQAGEGDAFLISLKAGGFGLNLTAADYVIHLDPWWNPAVEAQASDRAHRIGQQRPVTIYKLVNVGSIEQKVLALHARKRELAEELLQDAGTATKLDTKALMSLIEGD